MLFNVLSSFQIISVGKDYIKGIECQLIKLKYGAIYEKMKKYRKKQVIADDNSMVRQ